MIRKEWFQIALAGLVLFLLAPDIPAQEETFPLTIRAYVFSMAETQIREFQKDGISRNELDQLQGQCFEEGCLLPKGKPLTLQSEDNPIQISKEQIMDMQEAENTEVICLLFEVVNPGDEPAASGTIQRKSYAVTITKDGEHKNVSEKESSWSYPGGKTAYRYMDFRSATLFHYDQLVYNIEFSLGPQKITYNLVFRLAE